VDAGGCLLTWSLYVYTGICTCMYICILITIMNILYMCVHVCAQPFESDYVAGENRFDAKRKTSELTLCASQLSKELYIGVQVWPSGFV